MTPVFVKGTDNIADYLSRCLKEKIYVPSEDLDVNINSLTSSSNAWIKNLVVLNATDLSLEELKSHTAKDEQLSSVIKHLVSGNKAVPAIINNHYKSIMNELSICDELVLKQDRIVIPESLIQRVIDRAHESHLGINSTKRLLKSRYYFPGMDNLIHNRIKNCLPCQAMVDNTHPLPIKSSPLPKR